MIFDNEQPRMKAVFYTSKDPSTRYIDIFGLHHHTITLHIQRTTSSKERPLSDNPLPTRTFRNDNTSQDTPLISRTIVLLRNDYTRLTTTVPCCAMTAPDSPRPCLAAHQQLSTWNDSTTTVQRDRRRSRSNDSE
jgi:hypothetical protein